MAASNNQPIRLQLASPAPRPPDGGDWLHEIKFDGYRIAARLEDGRARLYTRSGLDWTERFGRVQQALEQLAVDSAILDGEIVALDRQGRADFGTLQAILAGRSAGPLHYQVFDLLQLDGRDLRRQPLEERRAALASLLAGTGGSVLRLTEQLRFPGGTVFDHACRLGLEGIVSKRRGSGYRPGRQRDWLKSVCLKTGDFVIVGFSEPAGSRQHFGALLLGEYRGTREQPSYAGKVGTGFTDSVLEELHTRLQPLLREQPPVPGPLPADVRRGASWVEPMLVAEVAYSERTAEGVLRHPRFRHLREDKPAAEARLAGNEDEMSERRSRAKWKDVKGVGGKGATIVAGVRLSNADRVLYPEQGVSKLELAEYYLAVAEDQLRWLRNRPLSLVRCPEGTGGSCFYQKHPGAAFADRLERISIEEEDGPDEYLLVQDSADVVALVQAGVLEIHAWGSTAANLECPDQLIFDLDPDEAVPLSRLKQHARELRDLLAEIGLTPYLRVTGGKGLHLVAPIAPDTEWDAAKRFSKAVAESLAARNPEKLTTNMSKAKRKGRVFIDYLRNGRGSTAITNWSTRARPGAPVAVPIRWDELSRLRSPAAWNLKSALRRLRSLKQDAWTGFDEARRSLTKLVAP